MKFRILVDFIDGVEPYYVTSDQRTFSFSGYSCSVANLGLFDISRIQQWTGYKDKTSGKELYVGDIVAMTTTKGVNFHIVKSDNLFGTHMQKLPDDSGEFYENQNYFRYENLTT